MKYEAVIFDLFGTLVPALPYREYRLVLGRMASTLSIPVDDFNRIWFETSQERNTGVMLTIEANIEHVCKELGTRTGDDEIRRAMRIRIDFVTRIMQPRPDAIEVLSRLKSQGFKIGLISNCSADTPVIWQDTPFVPFFDVTIFSSSVGMKKPDPRIYSLAMGQLGVKPEDCLYVGDGASQELAGAARVGMNPVLIKVLDEDFDDALPEDAREEWDGPTVSSLTAVLSLVE
ncbi:MAG TPA: HAD-IA family hydrolase [Dehalococcoidia bacterium]|nr:HAD-IA family hydrolase [Dehalococcoidia bacterium]